LYSSSLLFACCIPPAYYCTPADNCMLTYLLTHSLPASSKSAHLWIRSTDTIHRKQMSLEAMCCCVTSQRMSQLSEQKKTHVTWPLPTVVWRHRGHKQNTASPIVACAYFGRGLQMTSFYCCLLEHDYGAVAWQWVFTLQYFSQLSSCDQPFNESSLVVQAVNIMEPDILITHLNTRHVLPRSPHEKLFVDICDISHNEGPSTSRLRGTSSFGLRRPSNKWFDVLALDGEPT
jgi:hypothetical protein